MCGGTDACLQNQALYKLLTHNSRQSIALSSLLSHMVYCTEATWAAVPGQQCSFSSSTTVGLYQ